jgi:putative FmdB family regulatory protein
MPIYEFNCEDCNQDSEILVRSSQWKGHAECPSCGSKKLEKRLSVFATGSAEGSLSAAEMPPCSGMPSNCGRCSIDN